MSRLYKDKKLQVIPGNPGVPANPGSPATPEYTISQYTPVLTFRSYLRGSASPLTSPSGYEWITIPVLVWIAVLQTETIPAQPAVPASAGVAPTPTQISYALDYGWNSWARSIDPLPVGEYYECTLPVGISGAFIGIGPQGMEAPDISRFKHGILISKAGIKVFELGVVNSTLRGTYLATTKVRLVRLASNELVYVIITGTETLVFKSGVTQFKSYTPMYVYGYLYKSGDEVSSSVLDTGKVSFGRA